LYFQFLFVFVVILGIIASPTLFENSFAQQEMSPHHQWKKFGDPHTLTCKQGQLLLQKHDGNPACVMPSTYIKLVDRGYGAYDSSIMSKRPEMMSHLMQSMASNENLMYHWHEMLQKNPSAMMQTIDDWITQMKENPELLKNMLGPMISDPKLREKMIETMKSHSHMENSLKQHSKWMESVHQPMNSDMGHEMNSDMSDEISENMKEKKRKAICPWCPDYQKHSMSSHSKVISNSDRMMDMIHDMWINSEMSEDVHNIMIHDSSHMAHMSDQMMEPMLNAVMDDEDLRQQMIDLMLEHHDFMNTIRHDNPETEH